MKKLSLLGLILLAACAKNPATGGHNFTLVSAAEERAIGEGAANGVLKSDGLYRPASETTRYVTDLCNSIYAATEAASDPVQCNLLDTDVFNAAATPGYMLINRGLLAFMNSEAELAGVIGHESGHLTGRHISRSYTTQKVANALILATAIGVAVAVDDSSSGYLAGAGAGAAAGLGLKAYGRAHETQADALGQRYLEKAGYDPREMVNTVRAMKAYGTYRTQQDAAFDRSGKTESTSLLDKLNSSHPANADRLTAAIALKGEPPVIKPEDDAGRRRYMAAIEGLTYGPARRYGIARKGELVLTQQRVIVPLPADSTTAYIGSGTYEDLGTWMLAHPQSGVTAKITSTKIPAGRNPGTLIKAMFPNVTGPVDRLDIGSTTPETIITPPEGSDDPSNPESDIVTTRTTGYTATYKKMFDDKRYRIIAVSAPAAVNQMILVTITYPTEGVMAQEDARMVALLKNMRFLTKGQALKYRQLQLHAFTAGVGETVANRAPKLPVGALQEPLFRALNNLPEDTDLIPGQTYKTILDLNN